MLLEIEQDFRLQLTSIGCFWEMCELARAMRNRCKRSRQDRNNNLYAWFTAGLWDLHFDRSFSHVLDTTVSIHLF